MKKKIIAAMVAALMIACSLPLAQAAEQSQETVIQIVGTLGIMTGDASGDLKLSSYLTRAEYAKILVNASTYKDSVASSSNVSPFKDVSYSHWAAGYIKTAAQNGWITGYLDGTYRPNNYLTLEEAVTAALKLLGYSGSDFTGSYPYGQLALYRSLGLSEKITATQGSYITRQDCMYLIYNILSAKTKDTGDIYITTLGYSVNDNNEIDYTQLINDTIDGSFIAASGAWYSALPFSTSGATFYRNGTKCTINDISAYDVVYYSLSMKTVWAYNNKVSGTYEKASPNATSPTTVTISGKDYTVSSSSAAYALSSLGGFSIGDIVTLLLGKDGSVAGVISPDEANTDVYGVVVSVDTKDFEDANGKSYKAQVLTIADTAGETREYVFDNSYFSAGSLVRVSFSGGKTDISSLSRSSLTGVVNTTQNTIGRYPIADDIEILDVKNDQYIRVYPSRLSGITFASGDVAFYSLNDKGELSRLILNGVTNDMHDFGLITDIDSSGETSRQYTYLVDGTETTLTASIGVYNVSSGACMLIRDDGEITQIKSLTSVDLDSLNETYATSKALTFSLSGDVQVYVKNDTGYYLSSVSIVSDKSAYRLTAYYDKPQSEGGRIRIIVATPR